MSRTVLPPGLTAEEQARLRARYPSSRVPRPVVVVLVGVGAAIGLGWLIWAAAFHAVPPVSAQVSAFTVRSDTQVSVTLTVDRPDPSVLVSCRVQAKAVDFQPVGEKVVQVPATSYQVGEMAIEITTVRRATSASVAECSVN